MKKTKVAQWGGIEVSRLGFGCMRLPQTPEGKIDREKAFAMIDTAYKSGVNYFDTAYGYHGGESERFIGEALAKYPRDSYYLATKLPLNQVKKPEDTDAIFAEQLAKTGKSYFDFYMLHGINGSRIEPMRRLGIYENLIEKKKSGKIGRIGFSFHGDYEALCELVDNYAWDFVQIQINYVDYAMTGADKLYEKLCEKNIPVVVMEPVRGGYLANPPTGVTEAVQAFEGGVVTPAGWALRWCIDKDNMPVILSGMSTMEQVKENIETFSTASKMTPGQTAFVNTLAGIIIGAKAIPCTGCGYCMDCPSGVDIPRVFATYNEYNLFHNRFRANGNYSALSARNAAADACVNCGVCVPLCPQGIKIPELMPGVHDLLSQVKF